MVSANMQGAGVTARVTAHPEKQEDVTLGPQPRPRLRLGITVRGMGKTIRKRLALPMAWHGEDVEITDELSQPSKTTTGKERTSL